MTKLNPDAAKRDALARMSIANVRTGKLARPIVTLLWGIEGVGKTSFAASAPDPIFLSSEDGTGHLDVARFPEPTGWHDVLAACVVAKRSAGRFKTLVIDTLDWLEPLLWRHLCDANEWKNIEEPGYGKGYTIALDEWSKLVGLVRDVRAAGMNVILLAHSQQKAFKNPAGEDWIRYQLAMHDKAAALWKQAADCVLFANYDTRVVKKSKLAQGKGVGGARVMHTEWNAAFDAKNRFGLPPTLPLRWRDYWGRVEAAMGKAGAPTRDDEPEFDPGAEEEGDEEPGPPAARPPSDDLDPWGLNGQAEPAAREPSPAPPPVAPPPARPSPRPEAPVEPLDPMTARLRRHLEGARLHLPEVVKVGEKEKSRADFHNGLLKWAGTDAKRLADAIDGLWKHVPKKQFDAHVEALAARYEGGAGFLAGLRAEKASRGKIVLAFEAPPAPAPAPAPEADDSPETVASKYVADAREARGAGELDELEAGLRDDPRLAGEHRARAENAIKARRVTLERLPVGGATEES